MHLPLLSAGAAAMLLAANLGTAPSFDPFAPLRCAMRTAGECVAHVAGKAYAEVSDEFLLAAPEATAADLPSMVAIEQLASAY